jgi:hypothetical protein
VTVDAVRERRPTTETHAVVDVDAHLPDVHRVDDGPHAIDDVRKDELAVVYIRHDEGSRTSAVVPGQAECSCRVDARSISAAEKGTLWMRRICCVTGWRVSAP